MMHREYEAKRFNGTKKIDLGEVSHIDCEASDLLLMTDYEHCLESTSKYGWQELVFKLSKALNPPIMVTQAVLEEMEKVPEAKFYVGEYGSSCETKYPFKKSDETYYTIHNARQDDWFGTKLQIGDYIQADCPLSLQVLLQFNTEGELFDASN